MPSDGVREGGESGEGRCRRHRPWRSARSCLRRVGSTRWGDESPDDKFLVPPKAPKTTTHPTAHTRMSMYTEPRSWQFAVSSDALCSHGLRLASRTPPHGSASAAAPCSESGDACWIALQKFSIWPRNSLTLSAWNGNFFSCVIGYGGCAVYRIDAQLKGVSKVLGSGVVC